MPNKRNFDPFHESYYIVPWKTCPQCHERKSMTLENWCARYVWRLFEVMDDDGESGHMERHKVRAPSTYCRPCMNLRKANHRLVKKVIAQMDDPTLKAEAEASMRGDCAICHKKANQRSTVAISANEVLVICAQCRHLLTEAQRQPDPLPYAKAQWMALHKHLRDEDRIRLETLARTNLDYVPPHKFNKEVTVPVYSHYVCISLELSWRKVFQFMNEHTALVDG